MKKYARFAVASLLAGTITACSDSNDSSSTDDNGNGSAVVPTSNTTGSGTATGGTADDPVTGDTTGTATAGGGTATAGNDTGTDGSGSGSTTAGGGTTTVSPPNQNIPVLADPFAAPIPSPDQTDPFGSLLETDEEAAVAGGPPTTPKNLRVDLVSNDWAEFSWAPSNDDGDIVAYRVYRSDDHVYTVGRDQSDPASGSQAEIDKFFRTTSFIDCNYTRFFDRLHICAANGPSPGDTYSYQVTAIDELGNESPRSNPITITYHVDQNGPIPRYDDFYLAPDDRFAQEHDLSSVGNFINEFETVFEDEFETGQIDESKWQTQLTWGDSRIINGEQQYFVNTQAQPGFGYDPFNFTDNSLIIESIPTPPEFEASLPEVCNEPDPTGNERCIFLSGALSSHDRFGMTYGYVEGAHESRRCTRDAIEFLSVSPLPW